MEREVPAEMFGIELGSSRFAVRIKQVLIIDTFGVTPVGRRDLFAGQSPLPDFHFIHKAVEVFVRPRHA